MYDAYAGGNSAAEVAEMFGVSASRVHQLFARFGLMMPPPGRPRRRRRYADQGERDARAREMYELYASGASLAEVAAQFGTSAPNVRDTFIRRGLATRGP